MVQRKVLDPNIGLPADPESLVSYLRRYLEWMGVKNFSPATIRGRENLLIDFIIWCDHRGLFRPTTITKPILSRYQRHLYYYRKTNGQPLSFRAQNNRISAIRSWFKWLVRENYLLLNPASELELAKIEKRLPKAILTIGEVEIILSLPEINTIMGRRDRAILETFYSTGMRRMELCHLRLDDLDYERGTVMIRQGKGRQDRMVPIGERALHWIDLYLRESRPELISGRDDGTVFLSALGQAMAPDSVTGLVAGYVRRAPIHKQGACHLFRHTMATQMLEHGADIRYIQAMLGHAKLETTQIYTQVSIKKLKAVHTLTHPGKSRRQQEAEQFVALEAPEIPTEAELLKQLAEEAAEEEGG